MNSIKIISPYRIRDYDNIIANILGEFHSLKLQSLDKRIVFMSNQFLRKFYLLGALGEGSMGIFWLKSLVSKGLFWLFDACEYSLLCPSSVRKKDHFLWNILAFNYYNAITHYENRFHFICVDWNIENAKISFLKI